MARIRQACDECGARPAPGDTWRARRRADGVSRCPACREGLMHDTPPEMDCPRCGVVKPSSDFYAHKRGGRTGACKLCVLEQRRLEAYGITPQEYAQRVEDQAGCCAICGEPAKLYVDHDHETLAIRGLLCNGCNTGIGMLGDDPTRMLAAAAYVLAHRDVLGTVQP